MSDISAAIYGLAGTHLQPDEADFLARVKPIGIILFSRNIETKSQLSSLIHDVKKTLGYTPAVLIDQEGGRVVRLPVPEWPEMKSAQHYRISSMASEGEAMDSAYAFGREAAITLRQCGVNVNCAPVCDLDLPEGHDIIGDRAFGCSAEEVIDVAGAYAAGLMREKVMPVLKHIPGHGRATCDSHKDLPVIDASLSLLEKTDFAVFKALHDFPAAMTAHCIYTALDSERCASVSPKVISYIRERIGFNGALMSDDLNMEALEGSLQERADAVMQAGCDIALHCSGNLEEMQEIAKVIPKANERATHFLQLVSAAVKAVSSPTKTAVKQQQEAEALAV